MNFNVETKKAGPNDFLKTRGDVGVKQGDTFYLSPLQTTHDAQSLLMNASNRI